MTLFGPSAVATGGAEDAYKLDLSGEEQEILAQVNGRQTIEQICQLFNYKTRKSYYDIRRWVLENKIEALLPKKTGPKSAPKRTSALEKRVTV